MTTELPDKTLEQILAEQPYRVIERDGVHYTLLGTAHISQTSVEVVQNAIDSGYFDAVAVELDPHRLQAMTGGPDALGKIDLIQVIRKGHVALFAANLALAAYQRRLAEQFGIEPGAELKRAVLLAQERQLPVQLIDREVGITFKRASHRLGFVGRLKLGSSLLAGLFASEEVNEDEIEKLKQGDMLEASFGEFAKETPALYETIIAERDRYMASRLRELQGGSTRVLAVVGAGHLAGLAQHLAEDDQPPQQLRETLEQVPRKKKIPWVTLTVSLLILGGILWGFLHGGLDVGKKLLLQWVFFTGGLAALGCLLARGHPLSILAAAITAPLKPFRPGIPPGAISALIEIHLRKPDYNDFLTLRDDTQTLKGWYRNRVSRMLLNFILTNLGSATGVWLAGFRIFGKLLG
ncbi:MAG: TraB/GumN family protein [Xanthomonadaceae bacterium]|jgi:pheromone shutdown-related protein TraB|nr:TraB/GumN family protein [Xanthomonadaceae bacterium]